MNKLSTKVVKSHYNLEIKVDNDAKTFTNGDVISGEVFLNVSPEEDNASAVSIAIALKAASYTMLDDASSTPNFEGNGETHDFLNVIRNVFPSIDLQSNSKSTSAYTFPPGLHKYPFEFQLPEEDFNLQCLSEGEFLHKRGYIKEDQVASPVTLPPSLIYEKGINNYAKIEYSIEVIIQRTPASKPAVEGRYVFTFLPKFNAVTFSTSKISNSTTNTKSFEFKYKSGGDSELNGSSDVASIMSNAATNSGRSNGGSSSSSKFKSILKKALSSNKIVAEFDLQAQFIPHLEPYNSQFNSSKFVQTGDNLKDVFKLSLLTTMSYADLIKKLYPSNASTAVENLSYEPEKIILNDFKVKLVTDLIFKSQIFNDSRSFKTVLVHRPNINYPLSHADFQNIGPLSAQTTVKSSGSGSASSTRAKKSNRSKSRDADIYQYVLPSELLDAPIGALLPSFSTCNIKVEHRFHISATFTSSINPKQSATVKLRPHFVLLKDYYKPSFRYRDDDSLPVYTANYDDSDDD